MSNKERQEFQKKLLSQGYTEQQLADAWVNFYFDGRIDFYELEKCLGELGFAIKPQERVKMINNQKSLILTKADYKKISSFYRNMFLESCRSFLRIFDLFTDEEKYMFEFLHGNFKNHRTFTSYDDAAKAFGDPKITSKYLCDFEERLIDKLCADKRTHQICRESRFHNMLQTIIYLYGIDHVCLPYKTYLGVIQDQIIANESFSLYRYYISRIGESAIKCGSGLNHYDSCVYDSNYIDEKEADEKMKSLIDEHTKKAKEKRVKILLGDLEKKLGENK